MPMIWDYDIKKLKRTKSGRFLILQRLIDYGVSKGEKINLREVKKYWKKLTFTPRKRKLFKLLIWGK